LYITGQIINDEKRIPSVIKGFTIMAQNQGRFLQ